MVGKLAIFAVGYVLGARAGRGRYQDVVTMARWVAGRDEVRAAANLVWGAVQVGMQGGGSVAGDVARGMLDRAATGSVRRAA